MTFCAVIVTPVLPWTSVSESPPPDGRRERKKARTRDDLIAAATELFAAHGYDHTTIEEITERADVSPRTFFRHFASKEDVLFPNTLPIDASLSAAVARQPKTSNDLRAIRDAYMEYLPRDDESVRRALLLKKAIRSTPALEGRDLALQRQFRDALASAVAHRNGLGQPDDLAEMVAALAQAVIHLAFDRWADTDGRADLEEILRHQFDLVDHIFTKRRLPPESTRAGRGPGRSRTKPR
jgi:AcrR family transcriptional regulator